MDIDIDVAYDSYVARFRERFGEKPPGGFVKFQNSMVQFLAQKEFEGRLNRYLELHNMCQEMLTSGATINDAVVLEFREAAAWVAIEAPDIHDLFRGELGEPDWKTLTGTHEKWS